MDMFYPIKDCEVYKIKTLSECITLFKERRNTKNVIVESTLLIPICVLFINYRDSFFVYNIHKNNVLMPSEFITSTYLFNINKSFTYTKNIKIVLFLYIMVNYYLNDMVKWDLKKALDISKKYKSIVDVLHNYIGYGDFVKNDDVKKYNEILRDIIKNKYEIDKTNDLKDLSTLTTLLNILHHNGENLGYLYE